MANQLALLKEIQGKNKEEIIKDIISILRKKREDKYLFIVNYYTTGAIKTGYENLTLPVLLKLLQSLKTKDKKKINLIVAEIQNRFVKKLCVPAVPIKEFVLKATATMAVAKLGDELSNTQNTFMICNKNNKQKISIMTVLHECMHLSQYYELHKLKYFDKFINNNLVPAFFNLFDGIYLKSALPYQHRIEELEANLYAINQAQLLLNKGIIDDKHQTEAELLQRSYKLLRYFKFQNGHINSEIKNAIIKSYQTGVKRLKNEEFVDENVKKAVAKTDIYKYIDDLNCRLQTLYLKIVMFFKEYDEVTNTCHVINYELLY